jgi:quercetin dioxygenase-like cupin family protein
MKLVNSFQAEPMVVETEGQGVTGRPLVNSSDGATRIALKQFEVAPGGYTAHRAYHSERVIYILAGEGALRTAAGDRELTSGDTALLQGGEKHQITNPGAGILCFLCMTPALRDWHEQRPWPQLDAAGGAGNGRADQ